MQLSLPIRDPRIRLPMLDLAGAFALLGQATEEQIIAAADAGYLWAWNVGDHHARRIEYRFLAASLEALNSLGPIEELISSTAIPRRHPAAWHHVLPLVLPNHDHAWLTGAECKRALNCRRQHFLNLVSTGQLPGTDYRRGPGGSPSVSRHDFIRFLETRLIGGL